MISTSVYNIIRPTETFVFFEAIAATISVPPVLPLWTNAVPTANPHMRPPITIFKNGWSFTNGSGKKGCNIPMNNDMQTAP